MDNISIIYRGL